jgi:hypothetical protein
MAAVGWVSGVVVAGHGVASGRSAHSPYPAGSIALQAPFFRAHGIDLSRFFAGTVNVDVAPHEPVPAAGAVFDGRLRWFEAIEERFVLSRAWLRVHGIEHEGLWYWPDPATKPAHVQRRTVVELLMPWIEGLAPGAAVAVGWPGRVS